MIERRAASLDRVFQALADPTRRAMLRRLSKREQSIGELAAPFRMTFAAAAKHVKVLDRARLLRPRVEAPSHFCRPAPAPQPPATAAPACNDARGPSPLS